MHANASIVDLEPDANRPSEMMSIVAAAEAVRDGIGLAPEDLRVGLDVARRQMERGALAEALQTYAFLVTCNPADHELSIGLANCSLHAGQKHLASLAATAAIALQPGDPRGHLLAARAHLMLGQLTDARAGFKAAIKLARTDATMADARKGLNVVDVIAARSATRQ